MSVFEAVMLICFGVSWPISIAKSLRTRKVIGKSPLFMAVVFVGYVSGVIHKVLCSFDWVTALYALNMVMVGVDLLLYYRYLPLAEPSCRGIGD
ncbi:hypothetical protein JW916_12380 [Candidatus Sumerlaeota bacterium]|nr:hypothetical protein [Candidatus Sumerlaeota bacterium]